MKAPRHAQWLFVPALALGLALGPVASSGARELGPAVPTSGTPSGETPDGDGSVDAEPKAPESVVGEPAGDGEPSGDGEPAGDGEPGDGEPAGNGEPAGDGEPSGDGKPAGDSEPRGGDSEPEPKTEAVITVRPGPVTSLTPEGEPVGDTPSREAVLDPRRRFSDQGIVFRASLLAFGVAGLAMVPTVIGLQQGAYARRTLGQLETPSEASARPDVQNYERSMNAMAIVAGAVSATGLIAGAVLLGVGVRGRQENRQTTVAPVVGGGTAGLMLRGRF